MKKIMSDKSFWLILIISVATLVGLVLGVIFLTRENSKEFYSAGYIIDSTASKSDRYYFSENTIYKENLFNEYVFNNVDDKEVSTSKNNFIHYLDNSLSFMKNGVILDLDNFNQNIVPYYNITDKSIVQYNNGGYYIETADKTLVFGNFLGRITDNKYIVVGNDIRVKLAGNDESVSGDYFEILFVENGIVKVENQEGSYQTVSDGSVIYIGDSIKINLGDKTLNYGDEAKLNLTELTIDGNENIDIIPEEGLVDKDDSGEGTTDQVGDGTNNDIVNPDSGSENGDDSNGETTTVLKKEVAVNLIDAESNVNSITAKFQVIDTMEAIKGKLVLTVVDVNTGETVYTKWLETTPDEQIVSVSGLNSDCNYVMKVVDETNEISTQYFQKSFKTSSLDLVLKRELVTEDSLSYYLDFGEQSDVTKATISIYTTDNLKEPYKNKSYTVEKDNNSSITFDELEHNTTYVVKVHKVYIKTTPDDKYESTTSDITLKNKPTLGGVSVKTNNDAKIFTLMTDSVVDDDNAIKEYIYQIYEGVTMDNQDTIEPIYSFVRNELNDETLKIGETTGLKGNTDYWFKVIAKYYDNYRTNEVETTFSAPFNVVGLPTISFEPDNIEINRISGNVIINDEGCTVPFEGRECYNEPNNFVIKIYGGKVNVLDGEIIKNVTFNPKTQTLYFDVNGLEAGLIYNFEVFATVDKKNGEKPIKSYPIGVFSQTTANINALKVSWKTGEYSDDNPIAMLVSLASNNLLDESYKNLNKITFKLYKNNVKDFIDSEQPIATFTDTENVIEKYYGDYFPIDFSMFEYDKTLISGESTTNVDILRDLSGGELAEEYTIEVAEAAAVSDNSVNRYDIVPGTGAEKYEIPKMVLVRENVSEPSAEVKVIDNELVASDKYKDYGVTALKDVDSSLVRGYEVIARFDKYNIERIMNNKEAITSVNFYVKDVNTGYEFKPTVIEEVNEDEVRAIFFLEDGTDYNIEDHVMTRGNTYSFEVDLSIDDDKNPTTEAISFPDKKVLAVDAEDNGEFTSYKIKPIIRYYIENSSKDSITYKYKVSDPDNALCNEEGKYYIYYKVNSSEVDYLPVEYLREESFNTFTLTGLNNGNIYEFWYDYALDKGKDSITNDVVRYYFDGYYNLKDELKYILLPKENSNELEIIIEENEFLNRISAYLITLSVDGISKKYEKVISNLDDCNGSKCIVLNYNDLNTKDYPFKGKNIDVKLEAFYDNGYVGFGQQSLLGTYFSDLGYVDKEDASKVGFVYQTNGTDAPGQYFYIRNGGFVTSGSNTAFYNYPRGILGFEFNTSGNWVLNTVNLVDESRKMFVPFGAIKHNNEVTLSYLVEGINIKGIGGVAVNPKVLDKTTMSGENTFKFTSIIPNVSTKNIKSFINGVVMDIDLDIEEETLKSDYIKGNDGYSFYVDIYKCPEGIDSTVCFDKYTINDDFEHVDTVPIKYTNKDDFVGIDFYGLDPNSSYKYRITADMNVNGNPKNITLFTSEGVPFEGQFTTLNKKQILNSTSDVGYSVKSFINEEKYNNRILVFKTKLNQTSKEREQLINFDLKYTLSNENGQEFEYIISENDIRNKDFNVMFEYNVDDTLSKDDFVFGENYHELVITAVTTDLGKELELYRSKLINNGPPTEFGVLDSYVNENKNVIKDGDKFTIKYSNKAGVDGDNYFITSNISVKDKDKVIKDGIFYIRLQDGVFSNLLECKDGDENCKLECSKPYSENNSFDNNCRLSIKIEKVFDEASNTYKLNGTCLDADKYKNVSKCSVNPDEDTQNVTVVFSNLKPNTSYSIVTEAKTFSKNYHNVLLEPNKNISVPEEIYTKSSLGFSLGLDYALYNDSQKKLNLIYKNSTSVKDYLVGIEYYIKNDAANLIIDHGIIGKINVGEVVDNDYRLEYDYDYENIHPSISIPISEENKNKIDSTNSIWVYYYYRDEFGKVAPLMFDQNAFKRYPFDKIK